MKPGHIHGATRFFGGENLQTLAVREDKLDNGGTVLTSAWFPTPDEMARMLDGAPVYLSIMGNNHPAVLLEVGENVL